MRGLAEMDGQRVQRQILSVWTDIFGYGLDASRCDAWHRVLNDSLAELSAGPSGTLLLDGLGAADRRRGSGAGSSSAAPPTARWASS